jgi:hypothetical protein
MMTHHRTKAFDLDLLIDAEPARMLDDPPFGALEGSIGGQRTHPPRNFGVLL